MKKLILLLALALLVPLAPAQSNTWIDNVQSTPAATTATIFWTTVVPSTSRVKWGVNTAYGSNNATNTLLGLSHTMTITKLKPSTTYHFRVMSADVAGVLVTSIDYTFTTFATAAVLNWPQSTTPTVNSYNVYKATTSNGPWFKISNTGQLSYIDITNPPGTVCFYKVTSLAGLVESSGSSPVVQASFP